MISPGKSAVLSSLDMTVPLWQKRSMSARCLILGLLVPFSALHASGAGKGSAPQGSPVTPAAEAMNRPLSSAELKGSSKAIFQRVIQARLYQLGSWTLADPSQTPVTAARTIASLKPSFVTGLLRLPDRGIPGNAEVEAFNTVRAAVMAADKGCRFDAVLNVGGEREADPLIRRMKEITTLLHHDAWTLFVAPDDVSVNPEVLEDTIAYAHSQGQMAGYDGPLSLIPEGVDYIVVRAWDLKVNRDQIERLRSKHRVPLVVEVPTAFGGKPSKDCTDYVSNMNAPGKGKVLTDLAENQSAWGYRLAYPVFYPVEPNKHAFDATKEPILMVTIRSLLARFN